MRALIISGSGRYSDPWHPLSETSARLAAILEASGFDVETDDEPDRALARSAIFGLVVVNATDPWRNGQTGRGADPAAQRGLAEAVEQGVGFIAMHNAVASLRDYGLWRRLVGGTWVPGITMHPDIGPARVEVRGSSHAVVAELPGLSNGGFEIHDERYCDLLVDDDVVVLAEHRHDGRTFPTMWSHELHRSRLFYDALGHDERSFDAAAHVAILQRAAAWVTRR